MKTICKNSKAFFEYTILEKHTSGIQLIGSEVKAIRLGKVSITEAYCFINDGELYIKGMYIGEYTQSGKHFSHQPLRDRKLLLTKKEILSLYENITQKGLTIVPLDVILTNTGFIKLTISLCKGKKLHDKRNSIKEKDIKRDLERNLD